MDEYDSLEGSQPRSLWAFVWQVCASQVFGLISVILVAVWMGVYRGGFAWRENPAIEFNYHPLFMVLGFVFLYGDAMLVYRVFRNWPKTVTKILHMCIQLLVVVFVIVALVAVFDSHNLHSPPIPNLYSLHSWMGLSTVILFGLQFLCGFIAYLFPKLSQNARESYMSVHRYWGMAIYTLAIATCLMGICEKAFFSIQATYSQFPSEGLLINFLGVSLIATGLYTVYVVSNTKYKRTPLAGEESFALN